MDRIHCFLEELRDYAVERYEIEEAFENELDCIVTEKYNGDFATFMKNEILNEDYGSLRSEVERLYRR